MDSGIGERLDAVGTEEAEALRSKAGLANARLAHQAHEEVFGTPRWQLLEEAAARAQRPLCRRAGGQGPARARRPLLEVEECADAAVAADPDDSADDVRPLT